MASHQLIALLVAAGDVLTIALVLGHVTGPFREGMGLAACLLVPGLAIVGPLRLRNPVLEVGCVLAVGLAALVLIAQLAITMHLWHLFGLQIVVLAAALPSLLLQVRPRPAGAT